MISEILGMLSLDYKVVLNDHFIVCLAFPIISDGLLRTYKLRFEKCHGYNNRSMIHFWGRTYDNWLSYRLIYYYLCYVTIIYFWKSHILSCLCVSLP